MSTALAPPPSIKPRTFVDRLHFAGLSSSKRVFQRLLRVPTVSRDLYFKDIESAKEKERLMTIARDVRGPVQTPATFLHGVMPRSGTNFITSLLDLHPDVIADPIGIHELPLLAMMGQIESLQHRFMLHCNANRDGLDNHDFLGLLGNGLVAVASRRCGADKSLLFRTPQTHNLALFSTFFPDDRVIVLLRDGRDVITSTRETWRPKPFGKTWRDHCLEWTFATEAALDAADRLGPDVCMLLRYEDVVAEPMPVLEKLCAFMGLDMKAIPANKVENMPIKGSSQASKVDGEVGWQPIEKPKNFNPIGRWHGWSAKQRRIFESIAGDMMVRAGYEL